LSFGKFCTNALMFKIKHKFDVKYHDVLFNMLCPFGCVEHMLNSSLPFKRHPICKHTNLKEITLLSSFWLLNSSCEHFFCSWYLLFIPHIAIVYLFFSFPLFAPPYELHWLLVYKMEIRTKMWIMSNFCGCSIRISFLVIQIYISSMKVLYTLLNVPHNLLFLPKVRVMTNVAQVYSYQVPLFFKISIL
jgi:hypothetical protein